MADVEKLVDDVLGSEGAGVIDRRLAALVVGDDSNEAVADPAVLIADRPDRNSFGFDPVFAEAQR